MGIVIFTSVTVCLSATTETMDDAVALPENHEKNDDDTTRPLEYGNGDSLLELVHEPITDASRPLHTTHGERNTHSRWTPRLKKWKRTIARMLTSSSAVSHAVIISSSQEHNDNDDDSAIQPTAKRRKQRNKRKTQVSDTGDMFDYEMHEGARLISASLGLVSNTFGLIADGVRISGDTAAGFVGSSVRLMGTTVKSISGSFESAGRALEPKMEERRKGLTSERLRERQLGKGESDDDFSHGRIIPNARSVTSRSVRYVSFAAL